MPANPLPFPDQITLHEQRHALHLEYERLLGDAIGELIGLAVAHGYRGNDAAAQEGRRLRAAIAQVGVLLGEAPPVAP